MSDTLESQGQPKTVGITHLTRFEKEVTDIKGFLRKMIKQNLPQFELETQLSTALFNVTNKYLRLIDAVKFWNKIFELALFMIENGQPEISLSQCINPYISTKIPVESLIKLKTSEEFLSALGDEPDNLFLEALMEHIKCCYNIILSKDSKLIDTTSVEGLNRYLFLLRIVMQVLLKRENLYWLVYNGTVMIYDICRRFLSLSVNKPVAIEYSLWAAMCLEYSPPLLTLNYLQWRTTCYLAVSQAYVDMGAYKQAEDFTRRALNKVVQLKQLEQAADSKFTPEQQSKIFSEAALRLSCLLFRILIFTARNRVKMVLKPRTRLNFRDLQWQPWPRTQVERLLAEMFPTSSAQLLAIITALSENSKRTLASSPCCPDGENNPDYSDIYLELILAAIEIFAGGGGHCEYTNKGNCSQLNLNGSMKVRLDNLSIDGTLVQLAASGKAGATLSAWISLVKTAFSYELWDFYRLMSISLRDFFHNHPDLLGTPMWYTLELIMTYDAARSIRKKYLGTSLTDENSHQKHQQQKEKEEQKAEGGTEDPVEKVPAAKDSKITRLTKLANLLDTITSKLKPSEFDCDMIVDASMYLWKKCKSVLSSSPVSELKVDDLLVWRDLLLTVFRSLNWVSALQTDPLMAAEIAIRLCQITDAFGLKAGGYSHPVVDSTLAIVGEALDIVAVVRGSDVTDTIWCKELHPKIYAPFPGADFDAGMILQNHGETEASEGTYESSQGWASAVLARDLHTELYSLYYQLLLKTSRFTELVKKSRQQQIRASSAQLNVTEMVPLSALEIPAGKNILLRALFYQQQCLLATTAAERDNLLEESHRLVQKYEKLQRDLHHLMTKKTGVIHGKVPPAPILVRFKGNTAILKVPDFQPDKGEKVFWYGMHARAVTGKDLKARLNDRNLVGTGVYVLNRPDIVFCVGGLQPYQNYVFALAAYTAEGKLIGDTIGASTHPIPFTPSFSVMVARLLLAQKAFQAGCYHSNYCSGVINLFLAEREKKLDERVVEDFRTKSVIEHKQLNVRLLRASSPVAMRYLMTSLFIEVSEQVSTNRLFCNRLCDPGRLVNVLTARVQLSSSLLLLIDLATWCNDQSCILQAVTAIYGLLVPILFHKLQTTDILMLLERCVAALQEVEGSLTKHKRALPSIQHMIAVITFHTAKMLRARGDRQAANQVLEAGRALLRVDRKRGGGAANAANADADEQSWLREDASSVLSIADLKRRYAAEADINNFSSSGDEDATEPSSKSNAADQGEGAGDRDQSVAATSLNQGSQGGGNVDLRAIETQLAKNARKVTDRMMELTGHEDPMILNAYIAYMPARQAYKEVYKFRRRPAYFEYVVQVIDKALSEDNAAQALEWCNDAEDWFEKRDDQLRAAGGGGRRTVVMQSNVGRLIDTLRLSTFGVGLVDITMHPIVNPPPGVDKNNQKVKIKMKKKPSHMNEDEQNAYEDLKRKVGRYLAQAIGERFRRRVRLAKLRRTCLNEWPWRVQLNVLAATSACQNLLDRMHINSANFKQASTNVLTDWGEFEASCCIIARGNKANGGNGLASDDEDTEVSDHPGLKLAAELLVGPMPQEGSRRGNNLNQSTIMTPGVTFTANMPDSREQLQITTKILDNFRKALVIARRGQLWTMLTNAAQNFYDTVHLLAAVGQRFSVISEGLAQRLPVTAYMVADSILDMMQQFRDSNLAYPESFPSGLALTFTPAMDDVAAVNRPFSVRVVMFAVYLLYKNSRWEKAVDLMLRLLALTNYQLTDIVGPLLISCQRKLQQRIKSAGGQIPQPHLAMLGLITPDMYLTMQIRFMPTLKAIPAIDPVTRLDPSLVKQLLTDGQAFLLTSCPCDPEAMANYLRSVLPRMRYTAMALRYSRGLFARLLAANNDAPSKSQQQQQLQQYPITAQPPTASLLFDEAANPVETQPLKDWHIVTESYEKTIELLIAENAHDVASQAYREMGFVFLLAGKKHACLTAWSAAFDLIIRNMFVEKVSNGLSQLDQLFVGRGSNYQLEQDLLNALGAWGVAYAAVLLVDCAQLIVTLDSTQIAEDRRRICLYTAAHMLRALLRGSLVHPREDSEYAGYDLLSKDSLASTTPLIPGIQLTAAGDPYRFCIQQLIMAFESVLNFLVEEQCLLLSLPILCLYQYVSTTICRSLDHSVRARLMRIRILTDLRFFGRAHMQLMRLLAGSDLPLICAPYYRQPNEQKMSMPELDLSRALNDVRNIPAVEALLSRRLVGPVSAEIGPFLSCEIALAHAHLMVSLSKCIPGLPDFSEVGTINTRYAQRTFTNRRAKAIEKEFAFFYSSNVGRQPRQRVKDATQLFDLMRQLAVGTNSQGSAENGQSREQQERRWLPDGAVRSLNKLRGCMLNTAEQVLAVTSELLLDAACFTPGGVEAVGWQEASMIISARREQARISRQRQHGFLSARTALDALDFLQIWRGADQNTDPSQRHGVGPSAWAEVRLSLIRGLAMRITGVGSFTDISVERDFASPLEYCNEGISEAQTFRLPLMEARFHWMKAKLLLLDSAADLQLVVDSLNQVIAVTGSPLCRSEIGGLLRSKAQIMRMDVMAVLPPPKGVVSNSEIFPNPDSLSEVLKAYPEAMQSLLAVLNRYGFAIEVNRRNVMYSTVAPQKSGQMNAYFTPLVLVAEIKYRYSCWLVQQELSKKPPGGVMDPGVVAEVISHLSTALSLSRALSDRDHFLETEITYLLASLKRVSLSFPNRGLALPADEVLQTYLKGVELSKHSVHDLAVVKSCFIDVADVALLSLQALKAAAAEPPASHRSESGSAKKGGRSHAGPPSTSTKKPAAGHKQATTPATTPAPPGGNIDLPFALKECAAYGVVLSSKAAAAQRCRLALPAERVVSERRFNNPTESARIPDYVTLDLFALHTVARRQFRDWVEEELAELDEQIKQSRPESYDVQLEKTRVAAEKQLAAVHLLNYESVLERLCSFSAMVAARAPTSGRATLILRKTFLARPWSDRLTNFREVLLSLVPTYTLSPALEMPMFKTAIDGLAQINKAQPPGGEMLAMLVITDYAEMQQSVGEAAINAQLAQQGGLLLDLPDGSSMPATDAPEIVAGLTAANNRRSARRSRVAVAESEVVL